MSIEREIKYLICPNRLLELKTYLNSRETSKIVVKQGYINEARIREYGDTHLFSWKLRIGKISSYEVEQVLSQTDFNLLWKECKDKHTKHRYTLDDIPGVKLDIDFFYINWWENPYIGTIEAELQDGIEILDLKNPEYRELDIYHYIHSEVDNSKFSSRKLGDEKYARKLLKEIS